MYEQGEEDSAARTISSLWPLAIHGSSKYSAQRAAMLACWAAVAARKFCAAQPARYLAAAASALWLPAGEAAEPLTVYSVGSQTKLSAAGQDGDDGVRYGQEASADS